MNTKSIKNKEISKDWWLADAEGQVLGRFASKVAQILRGKHKVNFTPHMDMGDFVIIVNAEKIKVTGNKEIDKVYFKHTGYPGGGSEINSGLFHNIDEKFIDDWTKKYQTKNFDYNQMVKFDEEIQIDAE